jgi:hypothetical protein
MNPDVAGGGVDRYGSAAIILVGVLIAALDR